MWVPGLSSEQERVAIRRSVIRVHSLPKATSYSSAVYNLQFFSAGLPFGLVASRLRPVAFVVLGGKAGQGGTARRVWN
jgi:hypothetical protein